MIKNLKISEDKALILYKTASKDLKEILEESFGIDFFKPKKITDRIKTLKNVYEYLGKKREDEVPYKNPKTKKQRSLNAFVDIQNLSEVLNEGTVLNFTDKNQYKYYPYFERKALGWVFDDYYYYYFGSYMGFGFYYKSSELAIYAGTQFLNVYKDYLPE